MLLEDEENTLLSHDKNKFHFWGHVGGLIVVVVVNCSVLNINYSRLNLMDLFTLVLQEVQFLL